MRLAPGEQSAPLRIKARRPWNPTGIEVAAGEQYAFQAQGKWLDFIISRTAGGYSTEQAPAVSRSFLSRHEDSRRMPRENWFVLVGTVGQDESTAFVIGEKLENWQPAGAGELMCFANDVPGAYFNNFGSVTLRVTRIR